MSEGGPFKEVIKLFPDLDQAGEVIVQQQFAKTNTEPLFQTFRLGPVFPSDIAIQRILNITNELVSGRIKGFRAQTTFSLENDTTFDLMIYKPYTLRRYKKGDIVKVYEGESP